jgi:peptidoglycan hydrolase-like protein with peptidoglycan-binding domain
MPRWWQGIRGLGVEYEIVESHDCSPEEWQEAHRNAPSGWEVVSALLRLGPADARLRSIDLLTARGLLPAFGVDRMDDHELFEMLERAIEDRSILVLARRQRPMNLPAAAAHSPASTASAAKRVVLDKFIRVLLLDFQGGAVPSKSGPPSARIEVRTETGATYSASVAGGKADVSGIAGSTPSDCEIVFLGVADGSEPVPTDLPPPGAPVDPKTMTLGFLNDTVVATRSELNKDAPFGGWLNGTSVFQLRRREADVIELEQFGDGGVLLRPGEPPDTVSLQEGAPVVRGIDALRAALDVAQGYDLADVIVTGHDAKVSQERADAVKALLVGDEDSRKAWVAIALAHATVSDQQALLQWAAVEFGWACDPGPIDGKKGPQTEAGIRAFQRSYNADLSAGLFPAPNPDGPLKVDGIIGKFTTGALFDCWQRALYSSSAAESAAYLVVDDQHQTYPAELAEIATGDPNRWPDLNDLNPSMVRPDGGGWYPPQVGQKIFIPDDWDLGALVAANYECHGAGAGTTTEARMPLDAPGPIAVGCGQHHLTTPFASAENRRATQRAVEILFFESCDEPQRVCTPSTADPCTVATCQLYDPREFALDYLDPSSIARVFSFAIPVGEHAWPGDATVFVLRQHTLLWTGAVSDGEPAGDYRRFDVQVPPGGGVRAFVSVGGSVLGLFGSSAVHDIAGEDGQERHLAPPDRSLVFAVQEQEGAAS